MTKSADIKVYQGFTGNIVFELDKIQSGFATARPRLNNAFFRTGEHETWCFVASLIRDATEQEAKEYDALKEAFIEKENAKAVALSTLVRGELFRLPLRTDRFRVIAHTERNGVPITTAIKLNGFNTTAILEAGTKVIKL